MPPITLHMVLARQIAEDLSSDDLREQIGAYLLGATSPDVRILTREDRFTTHFFNLDVHEHQDSVSSFLDSHPEYAAPEKLNDETRAWVSGYLAHLAMDEHYITGVYRPFFQAHEKLGGRTRANVMDRLLQFDLDRAQGSDPELKAVLARALGGTIEGIECGFIDGETMDRWREVSLEMSQRNMDLDRMRSMISSHLRHAGLTDDEDLAGFLDSLPDLLKETIAHVTDAEIGAFVERATENARVAVKRYLACE